MARGRRRAPKRRTGGRTPSRRKMMHGGMHCPPGQTMRGGSVRRKMSQGGHAHASHTEFNNPGLHGGTGHQHNVLPSSGHHSTANQGAHNHTTEVAHLGNASHYHTVGQNVNWQGTPLPNAWPNHGRHVTAHPQYGAGHDHADFTDEGVGLSGHTPHKHQYQRGDLGMFEPTYTGDHNHGTGGSGPLANRPTRIRPGQGMGMRRPRPTGGDFGGPGGSYQHGGMVGRGGYCHYGTKTRWSGKVLMQNGIAYGVGPDGVMAGDSPRLGSCDGYV